MPTRKKRRNKKGRPAASADASSILDLDGVDDDWNSILDEFAAQNIASDGVGATEENIIAADTDDNKSIQGEEGKENSENEQPVKSCSNCDNLETENLIHKCGGCKIAAYCSTKCQKEHWKGIGHEKAHREICEELQLTRKARKKNAMSDTGQHLLSGHFERWQEEQQLDLLDIPVLKQLFNNWLQGKGFAAQRKCMMAATRAWLRSNKDDMHPRLVAQACISRILSMTMMAPPYDPLWSRERLLDPAFPLQVVLDHCIDPSYHSPAGSSPLHMLAEMAPLDESAELRERQVVLGRILLEKGVDVNNRSSPESGRLTPLLNACKSTQVFNPLFLDLLLERGSDVNVQSVEGWTCFMVAMPCNVPSARHVLDWCTRKSLAVDVNLRTLHGSTLLGAVRSQICRFQFEANVKREIQMTDGTEGVIPLAAVRAILAQMKDFELELTRHGAIDGGWNAAKETSSCD